MEYPRLSSQEDRLSCLTADERRILAYVTFGYISTDIAELLHDSVNSTIWKRRSLYSKLKVHNSLQASLVAAKIGVVSLKDITPSYASNVKVTNLTQKYMRVLELCGNGLNRKEIGDDEDLQVVERTIDKKYVYLKERLMVESVNQLGIISLAFFQSEVIPKETPNAVRPPAGYSSTI